MRPKSGKKVRFQKLGFNDPFNQITLKIIDMSIFFFLLFDPICRELIKNSNLIIGLFLLTRR